MVFKLKTGACMPPVHISMVVHSRFLLLDFLREAIIYLLASLGDRPRAYWHHHRRGQANHRRLSPFLSPQQDDVRPIGPDPLPRVRLFLLPNLVRVVDALVTVYMLLEQARNYGLGMDALDSVCSWNTNGIIVWAWVI